jgi:hypothetical protein
LFYGPPYAQGEYKSGVLEKNCDFFVISMKNLCFTCPDDQLRQWKIKKKGPAGSSIEPYTKAPQKEQRWHEYYDDACTSCN